MTEDNSLSQAEAIAQLQKTISQLKTIVEQLDETSVIDLPSSNSIQSLKVTATELESLIASKTANLNKPKLQANLPSQPDPVKPVKSSKPQAKPQVKPIISESQPPKAKNAPNPEKPNQAKTNQAETNQAKNSQKVVPDKKAKVTPTKKTTSSKSASAKSKVAKNPEKLASKPKPQKKWLLPGMVTLVLAIAIPLAWYLFANNQSELVAIKDRDLDLPIIEMPVARPTEPTGQEVEPQVTEENSNKIELAENVTSDDAEIEIVNQEVDDTPEPLEIEVPDELTTPNRPQKVAVETIPPQLKLTPDQNFIAALNTKIANLDHIQDELIVAINPDLETDLVSVTLTDEWYEMPENRQDKLLADLFKRSRQLQFRQLKISDSQQNLIARSPVVGKEMVVLRRSS